MASQPTRTTARRPTNVVQAEKAAKEFENSQKAIAMQAGIQHAAYIEHDLAMKVSDQTQ